MCDQGDLVLDSNSQVILKAYRFLCDFSHSPLSTSTTVSLLPLFNSPSTGHH